LGKIEVKESGQYRVQIQDLFNSGQTDASRLYRLVIRKEKPDFDLLAVAQAPPPVDKERREAHVWTLFLRRGETLPIKVFAFRRDNFDEEIKLTMNHLPAGVSCTESRIEAGQSSAVMLVNASENITGGSGRVEIVGKARIRNADIGRTASAASLAWDVNDYTLEPTRAHLSEGFYLGVSSDESAPLMIQAAQPTTLEAATGAKVQVPLRLLAKAQLTGNLKFKVAGSSAFERIKEFEVSSSTNQVSFEVDLASLRLSSGNHSFYLAAYGQTKYRRIPSGEARSAEEERSFVAYSEWLSLRVLPPPAVAAVAAKAAAP
jgi:hypothetical protein